MHKTFIYLLERKEETLEDDSRGFVILADTEEEARELAAMEYQGKTPFFKPEDGAVWIDCTKSTCLLVGISTLKEKVAKFLMLDFKAG